MNVPSDGFIIGLEGVEQEAVRPGGACLTFEEADDVDRGVVPQFPLLTAVGRHYRSFPTNQQTHKTAPAQKAGTIGAVYPATILASIQGKAYLPTCRLACSRFVDASRKASMTRVNPSWTASSTRPSCCSAYSSICPIERRCS